ncbi:MAG: hypothetical protein AAB320_09900 [Elusimicrobiota bacterium]
MERFDWLEVEKSEAGTPKPSGQTFDARYYFTRAEQAYLYGHYELALRHYGKALGEDSSMEGAWFGQVLCLIEIGELPEAKVWAGKALDRFPQSAELLGAKALVLARLGEGGDAMTLSDRAIAKKDAAWRVWLLRGLVLLCLQPDSRHEGCFIKALEGAVAGGYADLRIGIGFLEQGHLPAAQDHLLRATQLDHQNPLAWAKLGACFEGLYSYRRAKECYERALSLQPESSDPLLTAIARLGRVGLWARLKAALAGAG